MRYEKLFLSIILTLFISLSLIQEVRAANVALVVKNSLSLDSFHEKRIFNLLNQSSHSISLVDSSVNVDYRSFDLIVVAGRPNPGNMMDSFVANIPVNEVPTIGIDQGYPDNWGWVRPIGLSQLSSSRMQDVVIQKSHPLVSGFKVGDKIIVHTVFGTTLVDIVRWHTNFTIVGTADSAGDSGLIAYAGPGTKILQGKSISNNSAAVFFGIVYPIYWTEEADKLFLSAVSWLTKDSDGDVLKDFQDNCPYNVNSDQLDIDNDQIGDTCDPVDDRADLTVEDISLPSIRNQCEPVSVRISIKNIGQHPATKYKVEMNVEETGLTAVSTISLGSDQTSFYRLILDDAATCGKPVKIITVSVKDVEPGDKDISNNEKSVVLTFNRVKMDVDNDSKLEVAHDRNDNSTDGYEDYSDPNDNTSVTQIDGDLDFAADYLIDIFKDGILEKYWDPDEGILTEVFYNNDSVLIDVNGDSTTDVIYNTTNGSLIYLDKVSPVVGQIEVVPTFDGKTWTTFNISAPVSDAWTGIHPYSCKYTLDNLNWHPAQYESGKCFKNSLVSNIGTNLLINFNVRDKAGNTANGTSISRTVSIRPLSISINKDFNSYSPNSTVEINGLVSYADNDQKISSTVTYSLSGTSISGSVLSNSSGYYSFSFKAPTFGSYVLTVSATAKDSSGSSSTSIDVPGGTVQVASSSGGGGGSSVLRNLTLEVPEFFESLVGQEKDFEVSVKNEGNVYLYDVGLELDSDFPLNISADKYFLAPGDKIIYKIFVNATSEFVGEHELKFRAYSSDTFSELKITQLKIEEEIYTPIIELTGISIPEFFVGESSLVNLTLHNSGNSSGDVQVVADIPTGWSVIDDAQRFDLGISETKEISFEIMAGEAGGDLIFTVDYDANGQDISYQNTTSVSAKKKEFALSEITGMMAAVIASPIFYIPASIAVGIILYKFFIHGKLDMLRTQSKQKPAPRPKYIPNYESWEANYRRKFD